MIPKTLFLYWGGRKLSWLRYLTVVSFAKYNPGWKIKVYYPTDPTGETSWNTSEQGVEYTGKDWFAELGKYANLVALDMTDLGFANDMPEVHKSDLFRLWALREYGGVYCDFDVLYTKALPTPKERWYCWHPDGHYAIGLLAAEKSDGICNWLLESAKLRTDKKKYQALGSQLWESMLDGTILDGWNIPKNLIYSVDWYDAERLFTDSRELAEDAIGIHWYGGSTVAGDWENVLNPTTYKEHPSTVTNIIKEVL